MRTLCLCVLCALCLATERSSQDPAVIRGTGTSILPSSALSKAKRGGGPAPEALAYREAIDQAVADALHSFLGNYLSPGALAEAEPVLRRRVSAKPRQFIPQVKILSLGSQQGIVKAEVEARVSLAALRGALVEVMRPRSLLIAVSLSENNRSLAPSTAATALAAQLKQQQGDFQIIDPGELERLFATRPELRRALGGERNASDLGLRVLAELVCVGSVRVTSEATFLPGVWQGVAQADLEVIDCKSAEVVAAVSATFEDPIGSRKEEAARRARAAIFKKLAGALIRQIPRKAVEGLRVSCDLGPIYAALLNGYKVTPFGEVRISNRGKKAVGPLRLRVVFEEEILLEPFVVRIARLEPGSEKVIPVRGSLSRALLRCGEREVAAQVALEKSAGGTVEAVKRAVVVHGANVFSWRTPQAVAAYVDPEDPCVKKILRAVWKTLPSDTFPSPELARAQALWAALRAFHLKYRRDPMTFSVSVGSRAVNDRVSYPGQVLQEGAGDCDDFAVLLAAVFEAAGLRSAVVVCRDHVLVGVESGIAPPEVVRELLGADAVVLRADGAYLLLEGTLLAEDQSFLSAWQAAGPYSAAVRSGEADFVVIQEAWKTWKPAGIRHTGEAFHLPLPSRLSPLMRSELDSFGAFLRSRLQRRAAELSGSGSPAGLRKAGVLYAACGLFSEARRCFEKLFGKDDPFAVHSALGHVLLLSGTRTALEEAIEEFHKALSALPPGDVPAEVDILLRLAVAYRLAGDHESEKKTLARASAMDPAAPSRYRQLFQQEAKGSGPVQGGVVLSDRVRRLLLEGLR